MPELEEWTAADDAMVRRAMATLRSDVESVPLTDVRFVKARGRALRRSRFLTVGAAAAAAVVVAGTVGYAVLGQDGSPAPTPPASSGPPSTTTRATTSLDTPGVLPLPGEWEDTLGLPTGSVTVTQAKTLEGGVECGDALGTPTQQQSWSQANSPVSGGAAYWNTGGDEAKANALQQGVAKCQAGPGFRVTTERVGTSSIYSYATPDAGSGWFAVVSGGQGVALLQLVDPAFTDVAAGGFTEEALADLASVARARLERYATGGATSTPTRGSTPSTAASGPRAIDEQMPVSGPDPKPSSKLFVAASQWSSPGLTAGASTSAGPGALEGSTAVASCETDQQQAGIGGRVGVVSVRTGTGSTGYLGRQRVQVDESTEPAVQKAYVQARLAEAKALYAKGCAFPNGTVRSTPGPTQGTYRLDTAFKDGTTPSLSEWVGVTALRTPGAVTTLVITKASDPQQGFAELDRLLALARQK
jgi:hypothetical protein